MDCGSGGKVAEAFMAMEAPCNSGKNSFTGQTLLLWSSEGKHTNGGENAEQKDPECLRIKLSKIKVKEEDPG